MPKSRVRKKAVYTPPSDVLPSSATVARKKGPSPAWYPAAMGVVLLLGLIYIVVNYLAGERVPVMKDLGGWNFAIGFGLLVGGLGMAVRWR
ncbi:MAG: cell division protein CrgA [Actinobacteria bacterium]|nr:cell division protein CrgA [Actinomycetota bacterium]MBI3686246.1 cell division protein CrgA [Actinomycetota bacterium]